MKKSSANNITVKTADVSRSTVHIMDPILAADMGRHAQGYVTNAAVRILRTVHGRKFKQECSSPTALAAQYKNIRVKSKVLFILCFLPKLLAECAW